MIAQILKSLFTVSLVSGVIGYIGFKTTSASFVKVFLISTTIQFIFFYFYNNILSYVTRLKLEKENLDTIKLINTNNVLINCEACKKVNNVRVDLSTENEFVCEHCKSENILEVEYKTIIKTKI